MQLPLESMSKDYNSLVRIHYRFQKFFKAVRMVDKASSTCIFRLLIKPKYCFPRDLHFEFSGSIANYPDLASYIEESH